MRVPIETACLYFLFPIGLALYAYNSKTTHRMYTILRCLLRLLLKM